MSDHAPGRCLTSLSKVPWQHDRSGRAIGFDAAVSVVQELDSTQAMDPVFSIIVMQEFERTRSSDVASIHNELGDRPSRISQTGGKPKHSIEPTQCHFWDNPH